MEGTNMNTSRSKTIDLIAILLLVLALITASSFLMTGRFTGSVTRQFSGGNFRPSGRNFPGRAPGFFSPFGLMRTLGLSGPLFGYVGIGISVLAIVLLLISAYGIWKQKRWALYLGVVLAALFLLSSLSGLLSGGAFFNLTRALVDYGRAAISVAIIVMGVLPSVRGALA
jgi:hypothetical protein